MWRRTNWLVLVAVVSMGFVSMAAKAAGPVPTYTTIQVNDMHCANCAKKIASRLYSVPGVLEVRANVEADKAYVKPQKQRVPSPRALWEAVEKAGFKIVTLSGPQGHFKAKPQQ